MRPKPILSFKRSIAAAFALIAVFAPLPVLAQAYRCSIPTDLPRPRPDGPTPDEPRRVLPIGSFTLAITWSPEYCRGRNDGIQCGSTNRFGFTLHGLWPDGVGRDWPQYCRAATLLPEPVIRRNLCATPSVQLLQHEWAKHGTCMNSTPARYFDIAGRLYGRLRYPDMDALSRRPRLTAGQLAAAVARVNPGMTPDAMRITANRKGWLDEIWICLDRQMRYAACPATKGGLATSAPVKIWRGGRR